MASEKDIEISNAKEEISEIVEKCNKCGLCKQLDPVFKIIREESISARGRAILFSKNIYDQNVFNSTLDGSCKESCPFDIDIDSAIRKARKIVNLKGKQADENKTIVKKILNKQNPFKES